MHGAVCPAHYSGHLTDVSVGPTAHFVFESDAGMRAHMVPKFWTSSEISSVPGVPTVMTYGCTDESDCGLSEVRKQEPSLHAKKAGDQLRLWAKLGVKVSFAIHQTFYELFFLTHVRELQPDIFEFRLGDAFVAVAPNKCQLATVDAKNDRTTITMFNTKGGLIKVSDSAMDTLLSLAQWGMPTSLPH
jgi:hypothetical protein